VFRKINVASHSLPSSDLTRWLFQLLHR